MKKPIVVEQFADNGEHSHWSLISAETHEILWEEKEKNHPESVSAATASPYKFDINNPNFYYHNGEADKTKQRLIEMAELGMEETGIASFGIKNVMSGLYIEMVWSYSDEDFKGYLDWVRELIKEKLQNTKH